MRHARRKYRKLRMVQIDYKKAYDSAPHSWFLKSLDLIGAADNVKNILEKVTKIWKTTLTINSEVIGNVDISSSPTLVHYSPDSSYNHIKENE